MLKNIYNNKQKVSTELISKETSDILEQRQKKIMIKSYDIGMEPPAAYGGSPVDSTKNPKKRPISKLSLLKSPTSKKRLQSSIKRGVP